MPGIHHFLSSSLHGTGSGEVSWTFFRLQGSVCVENWHLWNHSFSLLPFGLVREVVSADTVDNQRALGGI